MKSNFFKYSTTEKFGIFLLFCLSILVIYLPNLFENWSKNSANDAVFLSKIDEINEWKTRNSIVFPSNNSTNLNEKIDLNKATYEQLLAIGLPERTIKTLISYRNKIGGFKSFNQIGQVYGMNDELIEKIKNSILPFGNESNDTTPNQNKFDNKSTKKPVELFAFDPNIAPIETLKSLGIPQFIAQNIINYRSKGGSFKQPDDLKKIYGFPVELFETLKPYITIEKKVATSTNVNPTTAVNNVTTPIAKPSAKSYVMTNINSATSEDWMKLKGIGPSISKRIIEQKEKLGGFYSVAQISEIWGLPDSTFQAIKPYLNVENHENLIKKLNINTLNEAELASHPFMSFKEANAIVNYRKNHGNYKNVNDLTKVIALKPTTFQKIKPYLTVN